MPKVSICIPAYKQISYVKRLLESIIIQKYLDYEVIITDDSPNNSIETLLTDYANLKIFYKNNKKSLGSPGNWNESIKYATGDFIKIMHHDDWFTNEYSLSNFVKMLVNNPKSDFAFSGSLNISATKQWIHSITPKKADEIKRNPSNLFLGNFIGAPSATIYRRNNLEFDSNLKWLVDLEFYIRLLLINNNFIYSVQPLVSIGISQTQVTNECLNNSKLKNYEYTYVYEKLNLHNYTNCRKYLLKILISNLADNALIKKMKISVIEYYKEKIKIKLKYFINTLFQKLFK